MIGTSSGGMPLTADDPAEGLVTAITTTDDDTLWFGTEDGLGRPHVEE